MKKIAVLCFLLLFLSASVFSADCDSVVITYHHSDYSGDNVQYDYFTVDSLHRIIRENDDYYTYDSLNRIIYHFNYNNKDSTIFDDINGVTIIYRYYKDSGVWTLLNISEEKFGVNGKDSVIINYNPNYLPVNPSYVFYYYLPNDSLSTIIYQRFDSTTMSFVLNDSIAYTWSPDFSFYIADHYNSVSGIFQMDSQDSVRYDSFGRVIMKYSSGSFFNQTSGGLTYYIYECDKPYITNNESFGGSPQGDTWSSFQWTFDSLCRPVSNVGVFSTYGIGTVNHHNEFYYADCNNILVLPHSVQLCSIDSVFPSPQVYGGTGILAYQWTPADSVSDPTILNPLLLGTTPQLYTLTITDQNGNFFIDSMYVEINTFTSSVTNASCQTCIDGLIQVTTSNPDNEISIVPYRTQQSPGLFMNLLPGTYWICSHSDNCATCDSVTVGDLSTSIIESGKDLFSVSPNPFSERLIIRSEISGQENSEWKLYDATSRLLKSGTLNDKEIRISTNDFPSGLYFLEINGKENRSLKLIKY